MTEVNVEGLNAVERALRAEGRAQRRDDVLAHAPHPIQPLIDAARGAREAVAHSSTDALLAERGAVHGDFGDDAGMAQGLKELMRKGKNWDAMPAVHREALEMMQTKVARILAGDFNHPDHWKDLQGYPRLVEQSL